MKPMQVFALLVVLGCAAAAVIWWRDGAQSGALEQAPSTASAEENLADEDRTSAAGSARALSERKSRTGKTRREEATPNVEAGMRAPTGTVGSGGPGPSGRISWPVKQAGGAGGGRGATSGDPAIPAELAFRALRYVGVDPAAEKTLLRAINDPKMPPGVRSDLIEDLNQEGYTDNNRPTKKDLPLILARLKLIERLAPLALDDVNAAAFEEAYKDLLNMYIRLGGAPLQNR
jgi:hypothetical protein